MRRILLAMGVAVLLSCGGDIRPYDNNDLQLVSGYAAKEMCSCLFVMEMDESFCRAWTKASPDVASVRIDPKARRVEAGALLFWGRSARYVDDAFGCVLE